MAHLHELGHRRVVLLNRVPHLGSTDYGPAACSRAGFEGALRELPLDGDQVFCGTSGEHYIEVHRFLEHNPDCTAAITLSMTFALLLAALSDLGRRVPQDSSVVAILAPQVAALVRPPLTTIDLPAFEMGRLGAEILIRHLLDGALPPSQLLLRGPLQVRSSGPPPRHPKR